MTLLPIATAIYYPDEFVKHNLIGIARTGCDLVVFDNSPQSLQSKSLKSKLSLYPNVYHLSSSANVGLSKALNAILKYSATNKLSAIIFFDQDTMVTPRTLDYINHSYGLWNSIFHNFYTLVTFTSKISPYACALIDTSLTINSGSLLNVKLIQALGGFNQDLFVDLVDYELCLRSLDQNLKLALCHNCPDLDHQSKQPDFRLTLLTQTLSLRRYPLSRIFSTAYAHFYLYKRYAFRRWFFFRIISRSFFQYMFFQLLASLLPLNYLLSLNKND